MAGSTFESIVKAKTDEEILEIASNPDIYDAAFLIAALNEIKRRKLKTETSEIESVIRRERPPLDMELRDFTPAQTLMVTKPTACDGVRLL